MTSSLKTDAMSGFSKSLMRVKLKPKWSTTLAVLVTRQGPDMEAEEGQRGRHGTAVRLERTGGH